MWILLWPAARQPAMRHDQAVTAAFDRHPDRLAAGLQADEARGSRLRRIPDEERDAVERRGADRRCATTFQSLETDVADSG